MGSSSRMVAGSWTSARAMATFIFSPCENPCVRRSASRIESERVRAAVGAPLQLGAGEPVQRAVVADVLARGQARVEAPRVRQHADALAHRVAIAHDVESGDVAPPPSGTISVDSIRSNVVLPAPLGPSSPVIDPSGAVNETSRTARTSPCLPNDFVDGGDVDHGFGARRSGHSGGRRLFARNATQASASSANPPSSTNDAMSAARSLGRHDVAEAAATMCLLLASVFATRFRRQAA